jgi:hypothetical protein
MMSGFFSQHLLDRCTDVLQELREGRGLVNVTLGSDERYPVSVGSCFPKR